MRCIHAFRKPVRSDLCRVGEGADLGLADNKYRVQVHANGLVVWMPGVKFRTTCKVDLTNFPFDTQTCYINITSWLYPTHLVHLNVGGDTVKLDYLKSNGAWDVEKATASRFTIETHIGSMSVISCAVELRRKPKYYIMHLIMPAVTMSSVSIFVFALPVESGEKISLGISVLLSYSVISLLVADNMPTNGDAIPVLCRQGDVGTYPEVNEHMLTEIRDFLARKIKQSRDYCKPIVTISENKNKKYVRGTRLLGGATWALTSLQLSLTTFAIAAILSSVSRFINFPSL
ncbi:Neuronal acetylcholine receptor subunit beta-3, partial [Lamellibrachia satsuma]